MNNDLKLRIKITDQVITLWEIVKLTDTYIMFRASISSGKKKSDGTWDNISQTFTCFVNGDLMMNLQENFSQKARATISGSLTMLPEKRTAMGKNGEYQEAIFSNATINVESINFQPSHSNSLNKFNQSDNYAKASKGEYQDISDDIPF